MHAVHREASSASTQRVRHALQTPSGVGLGIDAVVPRCPLPGVQARERARRRQKAILTSACGIRGQRVYNSSRMREAAMRIGLARLQIYSWCTATM